jgi:hypothetical protein
VIGQLVLLRLESQYTLAAITAEHTPDDVDLRSLTMYADGHIGVADLAHHTRGDGVGQWIVPEWPAKPVPVAPVPTLPEVAPLLMPAQSMPQLPMMPLMVIIRY